MQLKKLTTLILAVILTCFLAVSIFAVEDDPLTMAVEVSSSSAISTEPNLVVVKAGEEVKVKITVIETPVIDFYEFVLNYDSKIFTPKADGEFFTAGAGSIDEPHISTYDSGVVRIGSLAGLRANNVLGEFTFVTKSNYDGVAKFDFSVKTACGDKAQSVTNINIENEARLEIHPFAEVEVVPGSCVSTESTTYACTKCSYKYTVTGTVAGGHKFDAEKAEEKYLKAAATCTTKAVYYKSCSVCGEKDTNTFEYGEAAQHKFEDMITNNLKYQAAPADCVNAAKFYYSCSVCGEKGTETFDFGAALGHKEVVDAAVAATCTTAGKTEGKHCSVCNEVLVAQTEVKATGHKEVVDKAVAATCTTGGKTEGKHCSVCNTVLMMQGDIPALGHKEVTDKAVAATCTTAGKTEGKHCSVCNTVLVAQTEVKALGHKFDKESATDAYKATDATCTDKATFYKSCSVCGEKGTETFASGDLAAHAAEDLVKLDAVAPTCTETGLTEGEMCSKCNTVTKAQETVNAKGHVASDWVVDTEPKIGKEGKQYKSCTVCSSVIETEVIPAKSALPIILIIVAVVVVGGGVGVFFVLKNKKED
ncbi:MAG: hypothetical protein IJV70_04600 [Clostridia bacterium]|nr:hypothetical protein [Clostridia bacterium]